MEATQSSNEDRASPEQWLKKAYVLMNFGYFEEAMQACDHAVNSARDNEDSQAELVAQTLHGAILTASGRPKKAMRKLIRLHRQHNSAILCALYLAEACFLAGRPRRGWKTLDALDEEELATSPWREFAGQLRQTWEQLSELDDLPNPLTVPLGETPSATQSK